MPPASKAKPLPFLPPNRPRLTRERVEAIARKAGVTDSVYLVGIRGYYHDAHSDNQRGIYDDAIALVSPGGFLTFNANTDPSVHRHGIATLTSGVWLYKPGIHGLSKPKAQQYTALVQAGEVQVRRDGGRVETGFFGINIHRGGHSGTSSLGCQTIPPGQWDAFIATVRSELTRVGQKFIPYILID